MPTTSTALDTTKPWPSAVQLDVIRPPFALLATGGAHSSLYTINVHDGRPTAYIEMPDGNTPYALAFGTAAGRFALGTKGGNGEVHDLEAGELAAPGQPQRILALDSGIVAICFATDELLLASTVDGRVIKVELAHVQPRLSTVFMAPAPVCAFANRVDRGVIALTLDGGIYTLEPPYLSARRILTGPAPAGPACCVRLVPWPKKHCLSYMTAGGGIAVINTVLPRVFAGAAHDGDAICLPGPEETLYTIGRHDARVTTWRRSFAKPAASFLGPAGIVSGALLVGSGTRLALVDDRGFAGVYTLDGDRFALSEPFNIQDCRVIGSPPASVISDAINKWKNNEAHRIREESIEARYGRRGVHQEKRHTALCKLGHEPMSLQLRALDASDKGDRKATARYLAQMIIALRSGTGDSESLYEVARFAESVGFFEVARDFLLRLGRLDPGAVPEHDLKRVTRRAELASRHPWVIELGEAATLDEIAKLAAVFEWELPRRFILRRFEALQCSLPEITIQRFVEYIESTPCPTRPELTLGTAPLLWFRDIGEDLADFLLIKSNQPVSAIYPELGVRFSHDTASLVMEPFGLVTFSARAAGLGRPASSELGRSYTLFDAWFNDVHGWLHRSVQKLGNRAIAETRWRPGRIGLRPTRPAPQPEMPER